MFAREAEMTRPVSCWLECEGLHVKAEFATPWGLCDLVGLKFNSTMASNRLRLKQTRAIGSITRAALLLNIPDAETGDSTTLDRLARHLSPGFTEDNIAAETERLIADRFVIRSEHGCLQRLNGWIPLHDRLVAVELKRSRVEEAMKQALSNFGFAEESYAAFPADLAERIVALPSRWSYYLEEGVGLLAVTESSCRVVFPSQKNGRWTNPAVQTYCIDKFWNLYTKGN